MSIVREISCQEIVELVTDYLEGTMDGELRVAFEAHLATCVNCGHYLEQMEAAVRLAGTIEPPELSAELQAGLLEAFRSFRRP